MCVPSADLELVARAIDTADALLARSYGVAVAKSRVSSPRGFERTVARLAGLLRARAAPLERAAARAATDALKLDWRALAPRARERAVLRAAEAARAAAAGLPERLRASLENAAVGVVEEVRREGRLRQGLALGTDFNAVDRRVVERTVRNQTNFVRDALGRRCDAASARARVIVADGLERGLGTEEIARSLAEGMARVLEGRSPFYWDVVASSFLGTSRSFAHVSAFAEAGIDTYRFVAVMDEHTTPICRFMDGRTFSVRTALDQIDALDQLDDPEDVRDARPWSRHAADPETGRGTLYVTKGGQRVVLAQSEHRVKDRLVLYRPKVTDRELEALGVSAPPLHALCRSTVVGL